MTTQPVPPGQRSRHPLESAVLRLAEDAAGVLEAAARATGGGRGPGAPDDPTPESGPAPVGDSAPENAAVSPELAAAVRAEAARVRAGAAVLVVVGEKKRGKSSLINALVGHPGLLPVEVDVATGVHLVVRHADRAQAMAFLEGRAQGHPIPVAEIREYAALDPVSQQAYRDDVRYVEVGVPSPLLASGLVLIDTPGVGGLVSGHARITMAALARADALVFVVNGQSEFTASELRFLEQATERVEEVIFVLTQTDKYGGWKEVLERNRGLLAEHAPRYVGAPWFAVSSRAKEDADLAVAEGPTENAAPERLSASGFPPLLAALDERVAGRATELRLANCLRAVTSAVAPLATAEERALRSLRQDPTLREEVRERRDALRALQGEDATWRRTLTRSGRELERRLRLGFQRNVNDLRQMAEEKMASSPPDVLAAELPRDLQAGAEAIWLDLDTAARQGTAELMATMEQACGADAGGTAGAELVLARPPRLEALPEVVHTDDLNGGWLGVVERIMPAWGAGGLVAGITVLFTSSVVAPLAAGFGMVALLSGRRKRRQETVRARADAARYTNRLVAELTTEIPPQISSSVEAVTDRLAEQLTERLTAQRAALEDELAVLQRNLTTASEQLVRARERSRRRLDTLESLLARGRELTARLDPPAALEP
ncbi:MULTISPECIES: dynamin family protein [unclassified Streptomyces]|uniref:dynamin family protein n=1 Tax=unclassified Streptomyces TaxID=2593676 RepID=UPI002E2BC875|nr:dynamin family protein [Streptomyces sp. NBC_00223]